MLRNSERQTGHQVAKKKRKTGLPWLANWAVDRFVPSINANSKWGTVLPTVVPTSGWSTMMAALGGAAVGATVGTSVGAGVEFGRGDDAGAVADSGAGFKSGATVDRNTGVDAGTAVGPAARVAGETPAGLLTAAASDGGTPGGDWTAWLACVEPGGDSVAVVPQAKTPITTAINGRASSRDISKISLTVQVEGPTLGSRAV